MVPVQVVIDSTPEEVRGELGPFVVVIVECGEIASFRIVVGLGRWIVDTVETSRELSGGGWNRHSWSEKMEAPDWKADLGMRRGEDGLIPVDTPLRGTLKCGVLTLCKSMEMRMIDHTWDVMIGGRKVLFMLYKGALPIVRVLYLTDIRAVLPAQSTMPSSAACLGGVMFSGELTSSGSMPLLK